MEELSLEIIHERLAAGLGLKGGSRGSLTRCVGRLSKVVQQQQQQQQQHEPPPETNSKAGDTSTTAAALVREIEWMHLEMTKLALMADRQRKELAALDEDNNFNNNSSRGGTTTTTNQVVAARRQVQALRQERNLAQQTLACQREYESLARVACTRYPTPRRTLQAQVDAVEASTQDTQQEIATLSAHIKVREKQFAALLQCLADLQQSLEEPLVLEKSEQPNPSGSHSHHDNTPQQEANDESNNDQEEDEEDEEMLVDHDNEFNNTATAEDDGTNHPMQVEEEQESALSSPRDAVDSQQDHSPHRDSSMSPPKKRQRPAEKDPEDDTSRSPGLEPRIALTQINDVVGELLAHSNSPSSSSSTSHLDVDKVQQGLLTLKTIQNSLWRDLEVTRKGLDERKAALAKVQHQLQGYAYEADCLQAEIKVCREFDMMYLHRMATDEQATSVTDFLQADPTNPANKQPIVRKLQSEINARGILQRDLQTKQKTLTTLQDELKRKKAFLQSLPHHAATMERASSALQKAMFTSSETKTKELRWNGTDRRARLKLAQYLSLPLFTLYSSLQNYVDCCVGVTKEENMETKNEDVDNHKRMTLTVHAKSTDMDTSQQSVSWNIPIPDPVVATGRPKKITVQFQYSDGSVTAIVSGGASTLWAPTTVFQDLFPSGKMKNVDAGAAAAATTATTPEETTAKTFSWCNYLAGLHLPESHVHAASVRSIVRALYRRLRANAILKVILTALSRNQVPHPPVDAKLDDRTDLEHKCQLVSCKAMSLAAESLPAVSVYEVTLRQASRRLTVQIDVHPTRYPEVPPKWRLNLKQDETGQPFVYDEGLATMEHKVNVELLQSMEEAPEVAQEWLLVHQLHTLMNAWDEE